MGERAGRFTEGTNYALVEMFGGSKNEKKVYCTGKKNKT